MRESKPFPSLRRSTDPLFHITSPRNIEARPRVALRERLADYRVDRAKIRDPGVTLNRELYIIDVGNTTCVESSSRTITLTL